jgi:hypothetical protein
MYSVKKCLLGEEVTPFLKPSQPVTTYRMIQIRNKKIKTRSNTQKINTFNKDPSSQHPF